jgi:hypothetical protein
MIYSDELLAVAKRIFWFGTSEEALEFPKRLLTYAMTYASEEDSRRVGNSDASPGRRASFQEVFPNEVADEARSA